MQNVIVAVFESITQTEDAQRALRAEGVPSSAIHRYDQGETMDQPGDEVASKIGGFFLGCFPQSKITAINARAIRTRPRQS